MSCTPVSLGLGKSSRLSSASIELAANHPRALVGAGEGVIPDLLARALACEALAVALLLSIHVVPPASGI